MRGPRTVSSRSQRDAYWASKLGRQFGVPEGAYTAALKHAAASQARIKAAASRSNAASSPNWSFIGPQPMANQQANFGGVPFGNKFNATGRISAIAADPTTPGRIFVGAASGGLWMSTDSGATFTSIGQNLPLPDPVHPVQGYNNSLAVGAIALDTTTNPPTIYLGTGEGNNSADSLYGQGLFKSSDLGATWTTLGAPGQNTQPIFLHWAFARIALDPANSKIFAATVPGGSAGKADPYLNETYINNQNGLFRSVDAGASWFQFPQNFSSNCPLTNDVAIDPVDTSHVYIGVNQSANGTSTGSSLWVSTDGGFTFASQTLPGVTAGRGYTDRVTFGLGPAAAGAPNACAGNSKPCSIVYAMVGSGFDVGFTPNFATYRGFVVSTDGGATWNAGTVPSATALAGPIDGTSTSNFSQEFYDQALVVNPKNSADVIFGGVGLYRSTDSGNTWTFLVNTTTGGTHSDQHALAFGTDGDTVFVGNDGGLYSFKLSQISGGKATFTSLNNNLPVGQIQGVGPHPTNDSLLLAGFQDNGTQLYSGGVSWNGVDIGDGGFTWYDLLNPNFAYHTYAGSPPLVAWSSDGGNTWTGVDMTSYFTASGDKGSAFYPPVANDPSTSKRVFVGGHFIYVSTDGMKTFVQQETTDLTGGCSDGTCALDDIEFVPGSPNMAWAISMQSGAQFSSPPAGYPFQVFNTKNANLNSAGTWTNVTANLQKLIVNNANIDPTATQATSIIPDPNNPNTAYLTCSGFKTTANNKIGTGVPHILKTTDFGNTWTEADGGDPVKTATALPDVPTLRLLVDKTDATGNTLYAATDIGVFQSTDGGNTWASFNGANLPLGVPVYDIQQNNNGTIFIGTHGRGAYKLPTTNHPGFFSGEVSSGNQLYYLNLPHAFFGYYTYAFYSPASPWLFHYWLGWEYVFPGAGNQLYLYDQGLKETLYTDPNTFPFLYDFGKNAWLWYYTGTSRWFHNYGTGVDFFSAPG